MDFLEEFDETSDEKRIAILLLLGAAIYIDRRDSRVVDCSKTTWVLVPKVGKEAIGTFWVDYLKGRSKELKRKPPWINCKNR